MKLKVLTLLIIFIALASADKSRIKNLHNRISKHFRKIIPIGSFKFLVSISDDVEGKCALCSQHEEDLEQLAFML